MDLTIHHRPADANLDTAGPLPVADAVDPCMALVAAVMRCDAATVTALPITRDDVPGPLGDLLAAALALAAEGTAPDPPAVAARLHFEGRRGEAIGSVMVRAATATAWPEQVRVYAAAVLAARYFEGWQAMSWAIAEACDAGYGEREIEAVAATCRARQLDTRERLHRARGAAA